ncbi:zf-HC2 domain-containing protein [Brachybacterium hainanense]|uniref:Zf-HC2 domain-containing protein n=1 Tax=Brachybacterium hainanense TaxID=1541174 RepID=A0ABV6R8Y7_9MICO
MTENPGDSGRDPRYGLEEALDGELPRETVARMSRHTEDCPECADEWERLRRLKELVRRSCRQDVAPSRLRERISVECQDLLYTRTEQVTRIDVDGRRTTVTRTLRIEGGTLPE